MYSIAVRWQSNTIALGLSAALFALVVGYALPAQAATGAIYTTDVGCTGVNINIFASKGDVYLDGGPHHIGSAGLSDGNYFVQVTVPNGAVLGKSATANVSVVNGSFAQCYQLQAIVNSASSGFTTPGYDNTTNWGGEYKVWVSMDPTFAGGTNKTDNFKVHSAAPPAQTGSISGSKFNDLNADGVWQGGEPGLSGWTVSITGPSSASTQTDSNGDYSFVGLNPGSYTVCETIPDNTWYSSYPSASQGPNSTNCQPATVTANVNTLGLNFGNYQYATLAGQKWQDMNGNGTKDNGDNGIVGWTINIAGPTASAQVTDGSGNFSTLVKPGTYTVCEAQQVGWTQTAPASGFACTPGTGYQVTVTSGDTSQNALSFGNFNNPTLTVVKHVINDNGGTLLAPNFTLHLTTVGTVDFAGSEAGTQFTLGPGTYSATETNIFGYAETDSANCSGGAVSGKNVTCTITNDDIQPKLIVIKTVVNNDGSTKVPADFTMLVSGANVSSASFPGADTPGTTVTLNAGNFSVTEGAHVGYKMTTAGECSGTIAIGQTKSCTITNTHIPYWCSPGFWATALSQNRTSVINWLASHTSNPQLGLIAVHYSAIPLSLNPAPLSKKAPAGDPLLSTVLGNPSLYGGPAFNSVADYIASKLGWHGTQLTGENCPLDANGVLHLN